SGQPLDWSRLQVPKHTSQGGWLPAGGLTPDNVMQAICTAQPTAVDVSSGVCGPDGLRKDVTRLAAFIKAVRDGGLALLK
ncbi:hypothetical protein V8C86DRAFT_1797208, partial [Haematococcus lacustris]